jgi:hypothetical protein
MATEALVKRVKEILGIAKSGKIDDAYNAYAELFVSAEFRSYPMDEQRHAIKLVVNAKVPPSKTTPAQVAAYRAAMTPLQEMLGAMGDPHDFELLGICNVVIGEEKTAAELFRTGLRLERERNPQSDLCGSLMKWVAAM